MEEMNGRHVTGMTKKEVLRMTQVMKERKERETQNLQQAMRDWAKQYKEAPWLTEAKETFRLLRGRARAIGLNEREFEKLWIIEVEK